jgi:addiction module RelE/StbE family toxin
MHNGIPFEVKISNTETQRVIEESRKGINIEDCREFHLGGDMLIIYIESAVNEVILMRIGRHSQLF